MQEKETIVKRSLSYRDLTKDLEVRTSPNCLVLPTLEPRSPDASLITLKAEQYWGFHKAFLTLHLH